YRGMRRRLGVLLNADGSPVGGAWNFDSENRHSLGRRPPPLPSPLRFAPDEVTREVISMVNRQLPDSPGACEGFNFAVTRREALVALEDFVTRRLPYFGRYQDAMQAGQPFLFHSQLSGLLNLHLLGTREVLDAVLANPAAAPLSSVEGF